MKKTIKSLTKVLANTYILTLKKQNYHWNVVGANFGQLHELFGKQYEEQQEAIDEIAERIKAIGGHAVGSFAEYLELSEIKEETKQGLKATEMLKNLAADEAKIIKIISDAIKAAQSEGDEGSADAMIERLQTHQKNKWMLEASV